MDPFFSKNYTGGAFELFGTAYLLGLASIVIICLVIANLRHQFNPSARRYTRWGLLILIYLSETSWHIWKLVFWQMDYSGHATAQVMQPDCLEHAAAVGFPKQVLL